jgi:hypothetical protein
MRMLFSGTERRMRKKCSASNKSELPEKTIRKQEETPKRWLLEKAPFWNK